MAARRNVPYSALPTEDRDEDNVDHRFTYTPKSLRKIPWKSIALALFLLLLGSSLLFLSYFISTGHMEGDSSQAYGLLFLGILAFLPGNRQVSSSLKTKQVLLFGSSIIMLKTKLVLLSGISIVMPKTELDSMRLELLTIRGEEHQGTPLLPFQIISLRFFLIEWAVKILNNKDKNLKLRLGNK